MGVNERPTATRNHFRFSLPLSDAERLQLVTGKCQLVTSWKENNHITVEPETCIVCFSLGMRVVAIERRVCPRPQSLLAPLLIATTILTPAIQLRRFQISDGSGCDRQQHGFDRNQLQAARPLDCLHVQHVVQQVRIPLACINAVILVY